MKTNTNTIAQKKGTSLRLVILFVFVMFSTAGVFGQNIENNQTVITSEVSTNNMVVSSDNLVASSTMDFAVWFVGAQNNSTEATSFNKSYSKKALINSGVKTNSVLIRSILKKVSLQGNSVA